MSASEGAQNSGLGPRVSVVIAAHNAAKTIGDCLAALHCQSQSPTSYEVIVVDDGSTDETAAIVKAFNVTYCHQSQMGPAVARNRGLQEAKGDIILFTDADCAPDYHWIEQMLAPFEDTAVMAVKGAYRSRQPELVARFVQLEFEERYRKLKKSASIDMVDTHSAGFRRCLLAQMGGFDCSFPDANNEDTELAYRMNSLGHKMVFHPQAIVYHINHPNSIRRYIHVKFWRGYWRMVVYRRYPRKAIVDTYTPQTLKLQTLLLYLAGTALLLGIIFPRMIAVSGGIGLAFVATTIPFAAFAAKKDPVVALLAPFFLALRAAAIGAGILWVMPTRFLFSSSPAAIPESDKGAKGHDVSESPGDDPALLICKSSEGRLASVEKATLVHLLEDNALRIPNRTAIISRGCETTYAELNETANRLASFLTGMGLKRGERVGIAMPRVGELISAFLGIAKAHGVAVPIDYELPPEKIAQFIRNFGLNFVFVHSEISSLVAEIHNQNLQSRLILVGEPAGSLPFWPDILRQGSPLNPTDETHRDEIVYLNFTSGSTGVPKGAITTHRNIIYNTLGAIDALGLTEDDVHMCMFAPFAHPHEFLARSLLLGGTTVMLEQIHANAIAKAIAQHHVTSMMAVAALYELLLQVQEHQGRDLSSLRVPESGGTFTRHELIQRFRNKLGVPIYPVWGSTETAGIAIATRPGSNNVPNSIGQVCTPYTLQIIGEDGEEVGPGEIGEMTFSGPGVAYGYYDDPVNTRACFRNNAYLTGDLARQDEAGNVFFVERKSGMMKMAGFKIYPQEIEQALLEHPEIAEAAVVAVPDSLRGEIPKAIIVTRNGRQISKQELVDFCKGRLARYKMPRLVEVRDSLPKIGSGKINKKALQ